MVQEFGRGTEVARRLNIGGILRARRLLRVKGRAEKAVMFSENNERVIPFGNKEHKVARMRAFLRQ